MSYIAACLALFLSHIIPSAPGVRGWLTGLAGAKVFRIVYSAVSSVTVVWFILAYRDADFGRLVFVPPSFIYWLALLLVPLAIYLMVARLATPFGEISKPKPVRGIYAVTRFPGSWGVTVWAVVHMGATGDTKRLAAFGTFALIGAAALVKNEYVLRREAGPEAAAFKQQTSLVPFAAILSGKQSLVAAGPGWKIPTVSVLVVIGIIVLHPVLFGVDPLAHLP